MASDKMRDTLLEWLREAHAMAQHGETMLEGRAKRLGDYPELQARIDEHVIETREHRARIDACIARLDSTTSTVKDIGGKLSAIGHSWGTQWSGEEAVQSNAASLAFEHFEIANYRALIVVAEAADEAEIKRTCEEILAEEQAMAHWLTDNLTATTRAYLELTARAI